MIDIKILRNEPEKLIEALKRRKEDRIDVDGLLALDKTRRELLFEVEKMKSRQNEVSKQIPALKKEGKDTTEIFAEMKVLSDEIKKLDEKSLYQGYLDAMKEGSISVYVTDHFEEEKIIPVLKEVFGKVTPGKKEIRLPIVKEAPESVNYVEEAAPVTQGKLSMGFRTSITRTNEKYYAIYSDENWKFWDLYEKVEVPEDIALQKIASTNKMEKISK